VGTEEKGDRERGWKEDVKGVGRGKVRVGGGRVTGLGGGGHEELGGEKRGGGE